MKSAIVLAGGIGSRIESVAGGLPKALLDVEGRPFIEYVLDQLIAAGVEQVVIACSYKWQMIADYLGDEYRDVNILYSVEQYPLGTGGAIKQAFDLFSLPEAIVVNADTLFKIDLAQLEADHHSHNAFVTLALRNVGDVSRYGEVTVGDRNQLSSFNEKSRSGPGLINGGIYIIDAETWDDAGIDVGDKFSFETDVLQNVDLGIFYGFPMDGYFIDIGIPSDLERARKEFKNTWLWYKKDI